MKVLIYFNSKNPHDTFEGARLRKTLKGACESQDVPWVDDKSEHVEVAHFISEKDLPLLQKTKKGGTKTVVSALYCEEDLECAHLKIGRYGKIGLRKKAKALMNAADLVLVPSKQAKKLVEENGVSANVSVFPVPVNIPRFNLSDLESRLFLRYYGVSPERKFVMITGNFYERKKIDLIRGLAKALPKIRFYFFGETHPGDEFIVRHYKVRATPNLKFSKISGDDIYRSAMLHASAYLVLSPLPNGMTIMEAFAAKTPVIGFADQTLNPLLIDGVTAHMAATEKDLIDLIPAVAENRCEDTTVSAYAIASKSTLLRSGRLLLKEYNKLLSPPTPTKEEEDNVKKKEGKKHD
ncbi:MAG: glycosyltransferase [Bacilli bacterium]|nr:glycosyltransferase [Bacilli bacterium]